ncbi:MAG: hypothetical protein ACYCQJ_09075 [Nitrososphaerales archaeon]
MSLGLGVEPNKYKIISYNQLTTEEVLKTNYPIQKLIFWDVTASMPGKTAVDAPHITVYWYGPGVSSDKGKVVRMKSTKLESKYTDSIKNVVASKVGGETSQKEGATEFKDFTMKISYESIADLAKTIEQTGKLATEITLEFGMVTKEEKAGATLPKTKILGEKPLQE